ncbi:MAG: hypothetical protein HY898_19980 [Deltaproteobacteria bacterium]|nr:hypothetical protein [Deltaproteobacteria bacterium]
MHGVARRLAWWSFAALGCLGVAACLTSGSTSTTIIYPTTVTVTPRVFSGGVPCARVAGAWQTYVATLTDVTDPEHPQVLASSMPVSCSAPVSFYYVMPGHSYVAEIDGYDRSDIVPYGSAAAGSPTGSRHMVDPKTGQDVAPRWTSHCPASLGEDGGVDAGAADADDAGDAADASDDVDSRIQPSVPGASVSMTNLDIEMQDCSPLREVLPPLESAVTVDLASVRHELQCGTAGGEIDHFVVTPVGSVHGPKEAQCDGQVSFTPVTAGLTYRFSVDAFEKGAGAPRWATQCTAVAREGLTVPATCDSLTTEGALRIDIATLLKSAGRACGAADIVTYRAVLAGSMNPIEPRSCTVDTSFSPLSAGTWQAVVEALDASEKVQLTAWCEGAVSPAKTTTASCTVQ